MEQKYLKYKKKYLELSGGMPGRCRKKNDGKNFEQIEKLINELSEQTEINFEQIDHLIVILSNFVDYLLPDSIGSPYEINYERPDELGRILYNIKNETEKLWCDIDPFYEDIFIPKYNIFNNMIEKMFMLIPTLLILIDKMQNKNLIESFENKIIKIFILIIKKIKKYIFDGPIKIISLEKEIERLEIRSIEYKNYNKQLELFKEELTHYSISEPFNNNDLSEMDYFKGFKDELIKFSLDFPNKNNTKPNLIFEITSAIDLNKRFESDVEREKEENNESIEKIEEEYNIYLNNDVYKFKNSY